jgi:hypothetical protein
MRVNTQAKKEKGLKVKSKTAFTMALAALLFLMMFTALHVPPTKAQPTPVFPDLSPLPLVYIDPPTITANQGQPFSVSVYISSTVELDLHTFQMNMTWDPSILSYVSRTKGDEPPIMTQVSYTGSSGTGQLLYGGDCSLGSLYVPITSPLKLFTVTFQGINGGTSPIRLINVELLGISDHGNGWPPNTPVFNGIPEFTSYDVWPDINHDGSIGILDGIAFANHFFSFLGSPAYSPSCDFNADSCVDTFDLAILEADFGKDSSSPTWPNSTYPLGLTNTIYEFNENVQAGSAYVTRARAYVILVSGDYQGNLKTKIDQGTNQIFDDLVSIGYSAGRIYYLNKDPNWRVNAVASSANLQSAITSWAANRVGPWDPLLLIMFDHGGDNIFCINNPANPSDYVSASSLASWLNTLETATGASTYVVYTACESGSFIDELSKSGRVVITSCRGTESSYCSSAPYNEYFQEWFWPRIKMGLSLLGAFNPASQYAFNSPYTYHPLLDDNGNGVGHGWDTPGSSGFLPHDGDGSLAANVYLTSSIWVYPQIDSVVATQFYAWPPPTAVNLWAEVENKTPLLGVTAWMLPPDWSPPPPGNVLVQVPLEPFNMTELDESGNWTVNIPADAFVAHATGLSNFRFMITAEEANSSAIPFWTAVEFTSTGLPPPDTTAPQVDILRPKDMQHADGTIIINGTATDDVSLQKVELYVNTSLIEVINVPPESSSFFQFAYTPTDPLSPTEFTVKAFDTSGNDGAQTVRVNTIRDVAVTELTPYKTEVGQGHSLPINVTVANGGQLTEAFKVIVYANETFIQTRTVTLESGASTTLSLEWNTTGFAEGNYIIKAMASFLPYETNLANNEIDSTVQVVSVRDVAVTNVVANRTWVYQGCLVSINVTAKNNGDFDENVTLTLYYNITDSKIIGAQNVTLSSGQNETVAFVWDTTGVAYCHNYTLTAVATIPVEDNPADNTLGGGPINVRILGDIDGNDWVNVLDAIDLSNSFGKSTGQTGFNPDADFDDNGVINILDAITLANHYNQHYP